MKKLCHRIRDNRNKLHLSQEYVAKYLGVGRCAVVEIESGKRKVTADELRKLSELFQISADELLNGNSAVSSQVFTMNYEALDESDQEEIMNLIEFKIAMKNKDQLVN
jgi:transcriptional regulator with XRE-family HTH domain